MMADIYIDTSKLLNKLGNIQNIDLSTALNKSGIVVENNAKRNCPVDTGDLRRSITHELEDENTVKIYTSKEYAPYVEFGTGLFATNGNGRQDRWSYQDDEGNWHSTIGQHPQPFMQPALYNSTTDVQKVFIDEIRKELGNA